MSITILLLLTVSDSSDLEPSPLYLKIYLGGKMLNRSEIDVEKTNKQNLNMEYIFIDCIINCRFSDYSMTS